MTEVSSSNFGYLVAYIIPDFLVVAAASTVSPTLRSWLGTTAASAPTVGGFLYVTLASVGAGMAVSALRWLVLDTVHHRTGVPRPAWDVSMLPASRTAFETFVEFHYRHYQFYANSLVALVISVPAWHQASTRSPVHPLVVGLITAGVIALFFTASRDTLHKYVSRTNALLGATSDRKDVPNGQWLPHRRENEANEREPRKGTPNGETT